MGSPGVFFCGRVALLFLLVSGLVVVLTVASGSIAIVTDQESVTVGEQSVCVP